MKRPKAQGNEKWGAMCSEVQWSEVINLGEICVLLMIYSYLTVFRYLQNVIWLLFASLCYFLVTRMLFINILCMFDFCFEFLFSILCILWIFFIVFLCFMNCFSFCAVSCIFLYKSTEPCHRVETQLQWRTIASYHILQYDITGVWRWYVQLYICIMSWLVML